VAILVDSDTVEVKPIEKDRYGRTVARIFAGGVELSRALVKNGLAWVYRKYWKIPECKEWLEEEKTARVNGMGLWGGEPVPPWEWRCR
jgi:micrococcal nuclease